MKKAIVFIFLVLLAFSLFASDDPYLESQKLDLLLSLKEEKFELGFALNTSLDSFSSNEITIQGKKGDGENLIYSTEPFYFYYKALTNSSNVSVSLISDGKLKNESSGDEFDYSILVENANGERWDGESIGLNNSISTRSNNLTFSRLVKSNDFGSYYAEGIAKLTFSLDENNIYSGASSGIYKTTLTLKMETNSWKKDLYY